MYCTHERFPELVTCNLREFRNYFYVCIYVSNVIFIELLIVTVYAIYIWNLFSRWSDQGAFTGYMTAIKLRFSSEGVRWFDGKRINQGYEESEQEKFGYLLQDNSDDSDSSDEE